MDQLTTTQLSTLTLFIPFSLFLWALFERSRLIATLKDQNVEMERQRRDLKHLLHSMEHLQDQAFWSRNSMRMAATALPQPMYTTTFVNTTNAKNTGNRWWHADESRRSDQEEDYVDADDDYDNYNDHYDYSRDHRRHEAWPYYGPRRSRGCHLGGRDNEEHAHIEEELEDWAHIDEHGDIHTAEDSDGKYSLNERQCKPPPPTYEESEVVEEQFKGKGKGKARAEEPSEGVEIVENGSRRTFAARDTERGTISIDEEVPCHPLDERKQDSPEFATRSNPKRTADIPVGDGEHLAPVPDMQANQVNWPPFRGRYLRLDHLNANLDPSFVAAGPVRRPGFPPPRPPLLRRSPQHAGWVVEEEPFYPSRNASIRVPHGYAPPLIPPHGYRVRRGRGRPHMLSLGLGGGVCFPSGGSLSSWNMGSRRARNSALDLENLLRDGILGHMHWDAMHTPYNTYNLDQRFAGRSKYYTRQDFEPFPGEFNGPDQNFNGREWASPRNTRKYLYTEPELRSSQNQTQDINAEIDEIFQGWGGADIGQFSFVPDLSNYPPGLNWQQSSRRDEHIETSAQTRNPHTRRYKSPTNAGTGPRDDRTQRQLPRQPAPRRVFGNLLSTVQRCNGHHHLPSKRSMPRTPHDAPNPPFYPTQAFSQRQPPKTTGDENEGKVCEAQR
ncbi:hypothetical protein CC78DRAFT_579817 [Lojkania enalia]|uniref:Uncharacterized protein n=1 Tax=Lojkania enalia TaxID=147567 RepID=A0A9P4N4S1_9PLEO|nr:hypothetical protein CC78DRAFT_579817 [Didymosphaeria enalia]